MAAAPLMPKATAVWLVENTALSFDQVADFCKLHPLEVKAIADGDAAQGIKGLDPVLTGPAQPRGDREGRRRSELSAQAARPKVRLPEAKQEEGPALHARFAPPGSSERHSLAGAQSSRAQGQSDHAARRHHQVDHCRRSASAPTGTPRICSRLDPVTLGLCSQIDLDLEVHRAAKEKPVAAEAHGATLLPAAETTVRREPEPSRRRSRATSSTSMPCSPSSSRLGGKSE